MKSFRASLRPHAKSSSPASWTKNRYQSRTHVKSVSSDSLEYKNFITWNDGNNILISALMTTPAFRDMMTCGLMFRLPPADVSEQLVPFSFRRSSKSKLSIRVRETAWYSRLMVSHSVSQLVRLVVEFLLKFVINIGRWFTKVGSLSFVELSLATERVSLLW